MALLVADYARGVMQSMQPHHSSANGWFGPIEGLFDDLGEMIALGLVVLACTVVGLGLMGVTGLFAFRERAWWAYVGFLVLPYAIFRWIAPAPAGGDPEPPPPALARATPRLQPASPPNPAGAATPAPAPTDDRTQIQGLLGAYWFTGMQIRPQSKRSSEIPGIAAWPFVAAYAPDGTTLEDLKRFFAGMGVDLHPVGEAYRGDFIRTDGQPAQVLLAAPSEGPEAGHALILYQLKSISVDSRRSGG